MSPDTDNQIAVPDSPGPATPAVQSSTQSPEADKQAAVSVEPHGAQSTPPPDFRLGGDTFNQDASQYPGQRPAGSLLELLGAVARTLRKWNARALNGLLKMPPFDSIANKPFMDRLEREVERIKQKHLENAPGMEGRPSAQKLTLSNTYEQQPAQPEHAQHLDKVEPKLDPVRPEPSRRDVVLQASNGLDVPQQRVDPKTGKRSTDSEEQNAAKLPTLNDKLVVKLKLSRGWGSHPHH